MTRNQVRQYTMTHTDLALPLPDGYKVLQAVCINNIITHIYILHDDDETAEKQTVVFSLVYCSSGRWDDDITINEGFEFICPLHYVRDMARPRFLFAKCGWIEHHDDEWLRNHGLADVSASASPNETERAGLTSSL